MTEITIDSIENDGNKPSYFAKTKISLSGTPERMLSEQQHAENFRLRTSEPGYLSDWHTAGDPTLLIILQGEVEIELRNGEKKRFKQGDMFIARDFLADGIERSSELGHRARTFGEQALAALHLKLAKL